MQLIIVMSGSYVPYPSLLCCFRPHANFQSASNLCPTSTPSKESLSGLAKAGKEFPLDTTVWRKHNSMTSYTPEYLDQYNGGILRGTAIFFIVFEIVCVSLRILARKVGHVSWGMDDILIIPSFVFCLTQAACCLGWTPNHLLILDHAMAKADFRHSRSLARLGLPRSCGCHFSPRQGPAVGKIYADISSTVSSGRAIR